MSATCTTAAAKTLTIDGREVPINGERNLLELIRKAGIDLPTFCYHSDLSVYGACRLCLVDIAGRGIQGACSTPPEPGLKVRTQTEEIREIRKIAVELLLANHDQQCPTCAKSAACQLQDIARKLGIRKVRFKPVHEPEDAGLARRSRWCATRTSACSAAIACASARKSRASARLTSPIAATTRRCCRPSAKDLGEASASTAASAPRSARPARSRHVRKWTRFGSALERSDQDRRGANRSGGARGHRRSCSECRPANRPRGQMVAALKRLGFDQVYDTSFSADLTVIEEANEFLKRKAKGGKLPQFTSCCPGWVKFAEQYFPELLPNLSTCKSPQQMLGALCKATAAGGTGHAEGEPRHGFHHALHGQEVRGQAARVRRGRRRRKWITS